MYLRAAGAWSAMPELYYVQIWVTLFFDCALSCFFSSSGRGNIKTESVARLLGFTDTGCSILIPWKGCLIPWKRTATLRNRTFQHRSHYYHSNPSYSEVLNRYRLLSVEHQFFGFWIRAFFYDHLVCFLMVLFCMGYSFFVVSHPIDGIWTDEELW